MLTTALVDGAMKRFLSSSAASSSGRAEPPSSSSSAEQPAISLHSAEQPAEQLASSLRSAEQPAMPSHLKLSSIQDVQRWLAEEPMASCSSVDIQRIREVVAVLSRPNPRQGSVLIRAPSNKPARLIGGRTMHSGQGLTPENSMRAAPVALNAQSQQKLSIAHADAGVLYIDESSQLQGELGRIPILCGAGVLYHAAALRTTYARESKYSLNRNNFELGRIPILWYSQDHLQLPPVPESSSMLAPLEGTSAAHKVGAKIFRNAELAFKFSTAMRFTEQTLIQILEAMRTPGGRKLSRAQWQALLNTERSAEQPAGASAERPDESNRIARCRMRAWALSSECQNLVYIILDMCTRPGCAFSLSQILVAHLPQFMMQSPVDAFFAALDEHTLMRRHIWGNYDYDYELRAAMWTFLGSWPHDVLATYNNLLMDEYVCHATSQCLPENLPLYTWIQRRMTTEIYFAEGAVRHEGTPRGDSQLVVTPKGITHVIDAYERLPGSVRLTRALPGIYVLLMRALQSLTLALSRYRGCRVQHGL